MDRGVLAKLGLAAALAAVLAPSPAAPAAPAATGRFRCDQSVEVQTTWCTGSQITGIARADAAAVCLDFTRRLTVECKPDWDRFKSCDEFAGRFQKLLLKACETRKVGKRHCQDWGDAFLVGPLTRCQRGRTSY